MLSPNRQRGSNGHNHQRCRQSSRRAGKAWQANNYAQVIDHFPDLPKLTEAWLSHPLCDNFGQLDAQDHAAGRPFRTAMVYAKELSVPGKGFFDTLSKYRNKMIHNSQQLDVWVAEVNAVKAYYNEV